MTEGVRSRRPRSLAARLALWIALSATASLAVFALVAYSVVMVQEASEPEPDRDPPAVMAQEALSEVAQAMLVAAPIGLLLALSGATVLTRRAVRPLGDVASTAARITPRNLHERLPVPTAEDEVRAAVLSLNGLLDRLQEGFDALGRFTADASHELRTPLTVIATELEVALRAPRSVEEWQTVARTSLDEVGHLTRLVESLLSMARAEQDARRPRGPVDVEQLVARVLRGVGPHAEARGVRMQAHGTLAGAAPAVVSGDEEGLASALGNVVDNAVRYTPAGGEVVVSWLVERDGRLVVLVDDTGPGVDAAEAERIFEPFRRGAAARAPGAETGAGLGLSIARRILSEHDASLDVAPSPNGGARFLIAFSSRSV